VVSKPDHVYGSGLAINAVLLSDGDAMASGTINLVAPVPDTDTIQNISYTRATETLGPGGASASVAVNLPLGFSVGSDPTNHLTSGSAPCGTLNLDANLQPTNTSVVVAGPLYAVEETLPYCFVAPSLTWMITSGQIVLSPSSGVFARQDADDKLTAAAPGLTEPNTANRISNDGYFRNATPAGSSLIVTADANGVAHVATQLSLNPPELRPHFPYTSSAPGSEIPTGPGPLIITDNLADPASYLTLTGPAPVAYGRDCTYTGCTAALAGPAQLNFTPGSGQLNFTPDGGLLAYGSVPPDNLQWGYATGGNFAQQAGQVGGAAFVMAGTFLRADQTALPDPERASVLLFSGFGDAADPSYSERPGLAGYNDGFANYPGLNFRSPTQGQSYVGQHDSGVYSLDPVSKYYVRYGGVNGIHQAQAGTFPGSLSLYGYSFTFSDFGLSYLDGQNWQSVTTGAILFPPMPAGFTQPFDRMKLTCRGDLDSAQVPAGGGTNHLAYWQVGFTTQSLDFHPTNNDTCQTSPRFLVLGVETKLPFIPQALHASLGFQPSGNLVTLADNVSNVTSRFVVPGQLSLQGPGSTLFTLNTAAEGYFNNWATPGANVLPSGFYNLAGTLQVPFFKAIRVHLHVTPVNESSAQINVMGGWPAPGSPAPDMGWSVNNSNYFNQAD
ncbi:MAG TPA: hypothetical protein VN765_09495, partial [Candidatus Acidoferrum sp.]|nr:hypothetical protein [Candidatus Acidoferrum sp.]